jgi:hypothetical protein
MGLVRGEDVILSAYTSVEGGFGYVPFGCARSVTFDISTDFIETSVTESGNFKTFLPSGKQYSGNIEGLVFLDKAAVAEVRATAIINYSNIDTDLFPNSFSSANIDVQTASPINICNIPFQSFASLSDYINAIKDDINASGTGYTAEFSEGNSFRIIAPVGSGNTLNTINTFSLFNINTTSYTYSSPLTGGVTSYNPSKISMGWLYDKIISGEIIQLKYYETDDDNHYLQKECNVYIESINETASFDNMATFTANFKGNGAPTITYGEI